MAANKFATMLHRNTNKITVILIYAVLEWTLIFLLLLNSLFSFMIIKFAEYFGLKPPCLWCSRIDCLFGKEDGKSRNNLLCESHSREVSRLGFCESHQKLAESKAMCGDCSASMGEFCGFGILPWMKEVRMVESGKEEEIGVENGEKCSCCGVRFEAPYIVIKSSWDPLIKDAELEADHVEKGRVLDENWSDFEASKCGNEEKGKILDENWSDFEASKCGNEEKGNILDENWSGFEASKCENEEKGKILDDNWSDLEASKCGDEENQEEKDTNMDEKWSDFEASKCENEEKGTNLVDGKWSDFEVSRSENGNQDEIFIGKEDLVLENGILEENSEREMKDQGVQVDISLENLPKHLEFFIDCSGHGLVPIELIDSTMEEDESRHQINDETEMTQDHKEANLDEMKENNREEQKFSVLESMEIEEDENSLVFYAKDCLPFPNSAHESIHNNEVQILGSEEQQEKDSDGPQVSEDYSQMQINETEAEVSIGTEIPDLDIADDLHCSNEDPSTSTNFLEVEDHGCKQDQEETIELRALSIDLNENAMSLNETEEDKAPDTPSSIDSLHRLHRKLLLLEKKDSASEESLEGSVISEVDCSDPVSTIERLKSALKSERKALHVLYAELEEERSASAVAANQTMAMINRLQEEKAAMQMEALQYQRMMDEQSEYDQEALQLLNELMVKREKERQELERELEAYRKRVSEYEAKEKVAMLKSRSKDGSSARSAFSSASCSNGEESDGLSIDLNQEAKEDESLYAHSDHNTPVDDVVNLEDSLADFEDERMAILEQLKVLEEKLITMDYEADDTKEEIQINGHSNGHSNGYAKDRKMLSSMGKSLLPLFDAMSDENGDIASHEHENNGFYSNGVHDSADLYNKRIVVEEELDCLHERLQALEADREFLKHCISSLKKGDKGMDLLQEILQHLRDLRNVDLRVRGLSDGCLV